MTTPFWLNEPTILFDKEDITQLWPKSEMSSNQKLNAISRLVILLTLLGYLVSQSIKIIVTGVVTLGIIIVLHHVQKSKKNIKQDIKEGFTNPELYQKVKGNFTNPTAKNPFMNVLLPEISENPTRKGAAPAFNLSLIHIWTLPPTPYV